jgi:L-lactate dehydrogenase complex protein LldG
VSDARELMLARVRAALADRPRPPAIPDVPALPPPADAVALFAERAGEYRARVHQAGADGVAGAVAAICADHGARRLAVPNGLPPEWLPADLEPVPDPPVAELDVLDGVLTGCAWAIAETGTVVLDGGPGQGRRALTLVPDLHVCVVRAEQVLASVEQAVEHAAAAVRGRRAPLTLIAGPSATSDIELSRVEGVHGPRRLELVIVR